MKATHSLLIFSISIISLHFCSAQSTEALFSQPGLSIASYHGNTAEERAHKYLGKADFCNQSFLRFYIIIPAIDITYLRIDGEKVFYHSRSDTCSSGVLIYDFGLNELDTFDLTGAGKFVVTERKIDTILTGEHRRFLTLEHVDQEFPNLRWIEGIGDIDRGLVPLQAILGFQTDTDQFVCAKDHLGLLWQHPDASDELCDSLQCLHPSMNYAMSMSDLELRIDVTVFSNTTGWLWDFGDGNFSTELNPIHTYAEPGCYQIYLTYWSDCRTARGARQANMCQPEFWKAVVELPGIPAGNLHFPDEQTGWLRPFSDDKVWKTEDQGQTWSIQPIPQPSGAEVRRPTDICMMNELVGVMSTRNSGVNPGEKPSAILRTMDGGDTWQETADTSIRIDGIIMNSGGKVLGVNNRTNFFTYSHDTGDSWSYLAFEDSIEDVSPVFHIGGDTLYALAHWSGFEEKVSTLAMSFDFGQTWTHKQLPGPPSTPGIRHASSFQLFELYFFNAHEGLVSGYNGYFLYTNDGGDSWEEIHYDHKEYIRTIDFADRTNGWALGPFGFTLHTVDGGRSWYRENCDERFNVYGITAFADTTALMLWQGPIGTDPKVLKYDVSAQSDCMTVSISENEPTEADNSMVIYPNPTSELIRIDSKTPIGHVDIYDALGELKMTVTNRSEIDVSALPEGVYFLSAANADHSYYACEKFIVQH